MKVIKIKNWSVEKLHVLPSNFSHFVKKIAGSKFIAHTFEMSDGKFGGLLVNIGYQDQINLNDDFIKYLSDIGEDDLVPYVKQLFSTDGSTSLYEEVVDKLNAEITSFLKTEESVFDYSLAQPFNDNNSIAVVVRDFIKEGEEDLTYYQRLSTYLKCWFDSMAGNDDYKNSTSLWAGNAFCNLYSSQLILRDAEDAPFTDIEKLLEYLSQIGIQQDQIQCSDLFNEFEISEDDISAATDELKSNADQAKQENEEAAENLDEATATFDKAESDLAEAEDENKTAQNDLEEAKLEYENCIANNPPGDCEGEEESLKEAQEAADKAADTLKEKQDEYNEAKENLSKATQEAASAEDAAKAASAALEHQNEAVDCGQCFDAKYIYSKCTVGPGISCDNAPSSISSSDLIAEDPDSVVIFVNKEGEQEFECCYTFSGIEYNSEFADNNPFNGVYSNPGDPCGAPECSAG